MALSLPIPEGFEIPETTRPGDTFEVLATVRLEEGGASLYLEAIDGVSVAREDAPAAPDEDMDFLDAVEQRSA